MEPRLSDDLYLRFRDLLMVRSGLHYPERKRADLLHGLGMAMTVAGYQSLAALYADAVAGGAAWDLILEHLTIGETYFFRNSAQFDALRQHIIPEILQRRAATHSLRVWSAGCATGEEPYSLAITIGDLLGGDSSWHVSILATDINPHFLACAREALYSGWSFRETQDALRARFWTQEQNRWRLRPEIRRMVSFMRLNLAEPGYPSIVNGTCAIDLLVCRNVTIYFDEATTRQVIERFFGALAPGGWLIVGHSEPQASLYQRFETYNFPNTVVYRKPLDAPLSSFDTWRGDGPEPLSPSAGDHDGSGARSPGHRRAPTAPLRLPEPKAPGSRGTAPLRPPTAPLRLPEPKAPGSRGTAPLRPPTAPLRQPETKPRAACAARDGHADALDRPILSGAEVAAIVKLGRQCAERGDWRGAATHCEQALVHDPQCVEAHYLLAQIHEHQGALDAALAAYRRAIYVDHNFVPGLIGIGNIWRRIGRVRDARRYYQTALSQLAQLPATVPVPGAEGTTAAELAALINQHLRAIA